MGRWAVLLLLCASAAAVATYPAGYAPTYAARYSDEPTLREMLAELRGIRVEVAALRRQGLGKPAQTFATLKDFFGARCAGCHAEAVSEKRGAGFTLLTKDGKAPPLSLAEKRRIARMVGKGEMPPNNPLPEDEKQRLEELLNPKEED